MYIPNFCLFKEISELAEFFSVFIPQLMLIVFIFQLLFSMEEDEFFGEETFQHYCAEFIKHSQKIGDGWEWRTSKVRKFYFLFQWGFFFVSPPTKTSVIESNV